MPEEIAPCYICQCGDFRVRKGAVRDDPSLRVIECSGCGLVTLSSFAHVRDGHYEGSGMHGDSPPPIEAWLNETEEDDQRRFDMLKAQLVNRKVLDFGCGAGGFLRKAGGVTRHAAGIEPERRVRDHWGSTVTLHGSLEEAQEKYDVITAFHVLEHLPDPRTTLERLAGFLARGGRLVVEVPSSEDILLTLYDNDAFQRFTYWSQHLFLFNPATLGRLAAQAGLQVISMQQFQRYPLSNHLYWLSNNRPGGHQRWSFLDTPALTAAYAASLAAAGRCDTIIAHLER